MAELSRNPRDVLRALDFVAWDRATIAEDVITFFGWIRRSDGQRDFAYLEFDRAIGTVNWWATSSAKYSRRMTEIVAPGSEHCDCVPYEDALSEFGERTVG